MSTGVMATAFLSSIDDDLRPIYEALDDLEERLADSLQASRLRWPNVQLPDESFASFLGQRICASDGQPNLPVASSDLYLAAACLQQDESALTHFEDSVLGRIQSALSRFGLSEQDADDLRQDLRERLLVGTTKSDPVLSRYLGTGNLVHWVRAVASRQALASLRGKRPETSLEDAVLEDPSDPITTQLKEQYRDDFKQALHAAVTTLEPRERMILQALVSDARSVGEIAKLYDVHRVTASRWVAKIRRQLFSRTRDNLRKRLKLTEDELQSVVRMIESQMEMSLDRVLQTSDDPK